MAFYTSIITGGSNNHETTSAEVNAFATDFVDEGVIGAITNTSDVAPMTGAFAVNAQSTPDKTVAVTSGVAYVNATPTGQDAQTLRVNMDANENVTINDNTSGGTRYDWIYITIDADNAADSDANASNVASLTTSRSTSSSTDNGTPPTYGYAIAVVEVANGFSTITDGNITDVREKAASSQDGSVTPAKLAAINRQDNTTNNTTTAPKIQYGWGFLTPGSSSDSAAESVTFADAFASAPIVYIADAGVITSGDPTDIGDFNAVKAKNTSHSRNVTTTGFVAEVRTTDGTNYGATERVGYSWIAIGPA